MAKTNPTLKALQTAAKGLLFPSETDAPIVAFAWPGGDGPPTEAALRAGAKVPAAAVVEQCTLAQLTRTIPKDARADFKPLLDELGKLSGVTVFRIGEITIDVYIVGRAADGQYAGVKTKVVET